MFFLERTFLMKYVHFLVNITQNEYNNFIKIFFLIFILVIDYSLFAQEIYIRANQLGYLPSDKKQAIIFTNSKIDNTKFTVNNFYTGDNIITDNLKSPIGSYGKFKNCYKIDFSKIKSAGKYYIEINGTKSYTFSINNYIYNNLVDSLLTFFKIQRCGFNEPYLHEFCHYYDATKLILNGIELDGKNDLTGGWHDAGDYLKFLNTIAYTSYTLLFSYDFDNTKFSKDQNNNGLPDILDEAKIGINWLIKANYNDQYLVTQVQDLQDQRVGWRLPENDPLINNRPAYLGIGKNLIGIYSSALALAYRIFNEFPDENDFANTCLDIAEKFYSLNPKSPDIYRTPTGHYEDSKYLGKLSLSAIELYLSTHKNNYLVDAKKYANEAASDFWWSWGDINSFAHFRLAKIDSSFKKYIFSNLKHFRELSNKNILGEVINDAWGTNNTNLGVALQTILWQNITNDFTFNDLAIKQRDYILGKNPWGISFIYNIGSKFTKHFHSQIAYFNNGKLPGALSAGPISKVKLSQYNIILENSNDPYEAFQTDEVIYQDDRMDYITNEPTITANATAVFVFAFYSNR